MGPSTSDYLGPPLDHGRRPPRLPYRKYSRDAESVYTISNPASPLQSDCCPSPRFPPSLNSDSSGSSSSKPTNTSTNPSTSSLTPRSPNDTSKQKKKGFLSGLFDVKEPSAQALIDYERRLLKQGNGRVTAVGLPGISSAKLPPTVPKTNSKWDGVPQTVKEREKHRERLKRYSSGGLYQTMSSAESSKSDMRLHSSRKCESRGAASAHSRSSSRNNLAELYGWEAGSQSEGSIIQKDFAAEGSRPSSSGAATSFPAPTLEQNSSFPPHDIPLGSKIVRKGTDAPPPSMSGALSPPEHSHSPALTPCDLSPATPGAPPPSAGYNSPRTEATTDDYFKTTVLEVPTYDDEVIVKSAGANVLGAPATAKRRLRLGSTYYDGAGGKIETLKLHTNPILKKDRTPAKETPSSRPTKAATKPTMPAQSKTIRKGLGLAVNLKNQAHAPSLAPRKTPENSDDERIITPTPESGQSSRRNRTNLFSN
ncbi:hypothetical protein N7G274_009966 [Stereocaulon virgatum]|uniref:Uncharacterized protein n=1 Tax=Stereocaulon virgatum TaxID=373712 RepID=A0ABR3ZYW7_9LECA